MALGVDTESYLSAIDWAAFYKWDDLYPTYAGRYAGNWEATEFAVAYQATGGVLSKIVPLQGPVASKQSDSTSGYSYGVEDATATCESIANMLSQGVLDFPANGSIYVYLDVEAGTDLYVGYWAGWATTVYNYKLANGLEPFFPAFTRNTQYQQGGITSPMTMCRLH